MSLWQAAATAGDRPAPVPVVLPAYIEASASDGAWLLGSASADLYTTAIGLHVCRECVEWNPIGPTSEARIALKLGYTAGVWIGLRKLRRDGHGKSANIIRWSVVAINSALAVNNVVAMRRK